MNKWEYINAIIDDTPDANVMAFLNKYGEEGWELVTVAPSGRAFVFKRQIEKLSCDENPQPRAGRPPKQV